MNLLKIFLKKPKKHNLNDKGRKELSPVTLLPVTVLSRDVMIEVRILINGLPFHHQ